MSMKLQPYFPTSDYRQGATQDLGSLPAGGRGVTVAVFDSGVLSHPDFGDRLMAPVVPEFSVADLKKYFPNTPDDVLSEHLASYQEQTSQNPDIFGHGTHAASLIAGDGSLSQGQFRGIAPEARILPVQVAVGGPQARGLFFEGVSKGLDWIVEHKDEANIRVANFSIGMPLKQPGEIVETLVDPLSSSIRRAVEAGIVVVAAAGNFGPEPDSVVDSPAINPEVITVGGYDPRSQSVLSVSSRGSAADGTLKPDLLAPAVGLVGATTSTTPIVQQSLQALQMQQLAQSAPPEKLIKLAEAMVAQGALPQQALQGDVESLRQALVSRFKAAPMYSLGGQIVYIAAIGTSFAAPIVSGLVASMLEINPNLTPAEVKSILKETALPLPGISPAQQGAGLVQAERALARAAKTLQEMSPEMV